MTREQAAAYIDHTDLKAFSGEASIKKLCSEAEEYGFASVMVNPCNVSLCKDILGDNTVIGTVIGFPLGANTIDAKIFEAALAVDDGAAEIDYVVNIGKVKDGDFAFIEDEMRGITSACHKMKVCVKVIFENCYLTQEEITELCKIAKRVKPDFIKTSTGFGTYGGRSEDVALMKKTVGGKVKVKAAGGIRDYETFKKMIEAGAERIGTSNSVDIIKAV